MKQGKSIFITEEEKLKIQLQRSYTERFRILMRMIKLTEKMKKASIVYPDKRDEGSKAF